MEKIIECPYSGGVYFTIKTCREKFKKGEICLMGYAFAGEIDYEGEGGLNLCPIKGKIPMSKLEKKLA